MDGEIDWGRVGVVSLIGGLVIIMCLAVGLTGCP